MWLFSLQVIQLRLHLTEGWVGDCQSVSADARYFIQWVCYLVQCVRYIFVLHQLWVDSHQCKIDQNKASQKAYESDPKAYLFTCGFYYCSLCWWLVLCTGEQEKGSPSLTDFILRSKRQDKKWTQM